jgi:hypothetical protein
VEPFGWNLADVDFHSGLRFGRRPVGLTSRMGLMRPRTQAPNFL